jgi:predicted O-methyltransferase YrrM
MLDRFHGNITQEEADNLELACRGNLDDVPHEPGSTEPWISELVASFVVARGARTILETGCFKGATSVWLYDALCRLGGGSLVLCDIEKERAEAAAYRIATLIGGARSVGVAMEGDVIQYLQTTKRTFDLAWVDDCHEKPHVTKELMLLMPKMNPGGLILLHDVYGVCDLKTVVQQFGGYSLDLPRLGPAGGLGIIQC